MIKPLLGIACINSISDELILVPFFLRKISVSEKLSVSNIFIGPYSLLIVKR